MCLDPSAPLRLSGTGGHQVILAKKGFTLGAASSGAGYFEVGGDGGDFDEEVVCLCALMSVIVARLW